MTLMRIVFLTVVFGLTACSERKSSNTFVNHKVVAVSGVQKVKSTHGSDVLECFSSDLSFYFDFKLRRERRKADADEDSSRMVIIVLEKNSRNKIDSISLSCPDRFDFIFGNCDNLRSFVTKKNLDMDIVDEFYGDFIVADFNFDNREDFAVINDVGGTSGAFYTYFLQNAKRKFLPDKFLTDSMVFFPEEINKKEKILKTVVRFGCCQLLELKYRFKPGTRSWKCLSRQAFVPGNEIRKEENYIGN